MRVMSRSRRATLLVASLVLVSNVMACTDVSTDPPMLFPSWTQAGCQLGYVGIVVGGIEECFDAADSDDDRVPDAFEALLLERYRPFYRFSDDGGQDAYRPIDAIDFVRQSGLVEAAPIGRATLVTRSQTRDNPPAVLTPASTVGAGVCKQTLLDPPEDFAFRQGASWADVLSQGNIGLYGHVVALDGKGRYAVEYWQFFAYNVAGDPGHWWDHEGDWVTVQVVVEPAARNRELITVIHSLHGNINRFSFRNDDGTAAEYTASEPTAISGYGSMIKYLSSDGTVSLFTEAGGLALHPVAYVEHGGHEFWRAADGVHPFSHNHNGQGHQLLVHHVPNLGEVDAPMSAQLAVIVNFSGLWGSRRGLLATNPPGPPLHKEWHWPATSRIRQNVNDNCFEA